eukprot:6200913-Pleurochrysis_carterae.AAC.3
MLRKRNSARRVKQCEEADSAQYEELHLILGIGGSVSVAALRAQANLRLGERVSCLVQSPRMQVAHTIVELCAECIALCMCACACTCTRARAGLRADA